MRTFNSFAAFARNVADAATSSPAIGDAAAPIAPTVTGIVPNVDTTSGSNIAAPKRVKAKPAAKPAASGKPAKPGKAKAATAEIEAKPDPRVARAERISAERTDIAALYAGFEANRVSIPVKSLSAFKPATTTAHPIGRNPSARQAAAICVALAAANVKLADGAKAPRVFDGKNGVRTCIENGVLRDAVASGLIRVSGSSPETEILTIASKQAAVISGLVGGAILKRAKLA